MLRPPRRHARSLLGLLAIVASVGLSWPAGIAASRPSGAPGASSGAAPEARSERGPTVRGLGARSLDSARGHGPAKPLQTLKVDHANRNGAKTSETNVGTAGAVTPPATVVAALSSAPAATSFGGWTGLAQLAAPAVEPPDPWVAVGPDDVIQTVNTRLRFTNREGTKTEEDLDIFEFFDLAGFAVEIDGIADPRWMYDAKHNRWLGMTLGWHCDTDGSTGGNDSIGYVFGAISLTGDPTGDYYHYYVQYTGFLPDYPMIGTSADKITIAANEFILNNTDDCTAGIPFDVATLTTFDWANMLTLPASPVFKYHFPPDFFPPDLFTLRPAVSPQGATNAIFVVGEKVLSGAATTSNVAYMRITGTNAANNISLSTTRDLTAEGIVSPFTDPPRPDDPGGVLDAGIVDRRPTDAIWQDNILTFPSTGRCLGQTQSCARVTQLDTSTTQPTLVQDMQIRTTGKDTWFPGVGQSQTGILHVVYSQSSSTEGMTPYDRYQLPSDAVNKLSPPRRIASGGTFAYSGDRWGDYVGVAQDPRDTNAVWQANQYTKSNGTWGTFVSELQTPGSTFVAIDPVRILDSRSNKGTTGPFTSSVPKSVDIAGRLGIPSDAVAITGNLTITGQQGAGYAALTPLPDANPATSTINFPLGDNRANNITSPLSNAGGVSLTYKSIAGRQTHFILDVTGYFLNRDIVTSLTYTVLSPVRVLDTRDDIGLANTFKANVNRTFQVAGELGIPATAKAITGNLTVTNATGAGYVTLATEPPPALPATSTINFPAGDTRANGVTIKLDDDGMLSAVYKAPNGRTAHLILDVTGYYLQNLNGARFVALTPGRRMDTRFASPPQSLTGPFSANVARTLVIEPYQGVPGNATAITGNLTVVGQTRAGFVSMTTVANNNPGTSTLNFPLGDIRANGVTGPLSGSGNVGLVYKASGGLTHLILDLTGYFR